MALPPLPMAAGHPGMEFGLPGQFQSPQVSFVAASDRKELLCSSISIKESLDNPTAFCAVSG